MIVVVVVADTAHHTRPFYLSTQQVGITLTPFTNDKTNTLPKVT